MFGRCIPSLSLQSYRFLSLSSLYNFAWTLLQGKDIFRKVAKCVLLLLDFFLSRNLPFYTNIHFKNDFISPGIGLMETWVPAGSQTDTPPPIVRARGFLSAQTLPRVPSHSHPSRLHEHSPLNPMYIPLRTPLTRVCSLTPCQQIPSSTPNCLLQ